MMVDPARAAASYDYGGKRWYFCNPRCLEKFRAEPSKYTGEAPPPRPAPAVSAAPTTYTCPMHPEVVRTGPGSCPICGMALEPRTVSLEPETNPELTDMQRRFRASVLATAPILLMTMG